MAKRYYTDIDTTALPKAVADALASYRAGIGKLGIQEMLRSFNNDRSALAQALAGTTNKASKAYQTQMKNISRWTRGDRDPGRSKVTQERFRNLYLQRNPPAQMDVTITGWIGYDAAFYYRTIRTSLPARGQTVPQFLDRIRSGDVQGAYDTIFAAYGVGGGVLRVAADNPQVTITFHKD